MIKIVKKKNIYKIQKYMWYFIKLKDIKKKPNTNLSQRIQNTRIYVLSKNKYFEEFQ